jgi:Mn2+/Fe2+ NRAMP family transporter
VALGLVTSIGGFLEIGSITTAAQGGAAFTYQLGWSIALGTLCLALLLEMSGRLAAVSKHTIVDAIRERFGLPFSLIPAVVVVVVSFLVMASELGGVALALQFATGIGIRWWALPIALVAWLLLWKGTFGLVEQGVSLLGLVTLVFLVGAIKLHPDWGAVARGLVPTLPHKEPMHYWFIAVSILGASISPYLFIFYSSGAIEDQWNSSYLPMNRITAGVGTAFGGALALMVLVAAGAVLVPRGIQVDSVQQVALLLTHVLGRWGFVLVVLSLAIGSFGAVAEIALASAYIVAQELGWNWSEDIRPRDASRFAMVYTVLVVLAAVPIILGLDPLKLTMLSMALTAASLPVSVVPFLLLMNDERYVQQHTNGWLGNTAVALIVMMSCVLAIVSIPLEVLGG